MNRFLIVPLVLFVCVFVTVIIVRSSSPSNEAIEINEGVANAISNNSLVSSNNLLSREEAEELVIQRIEAHDRRYRELSRARIVPEVKVMTVQFDSIVAPQSHFFLGKVSVEGKRDSHEMPVAVDRLARKVYTYSGTHWMEKEATVLNKDSSDSRGMF